MKAAITLNSGEKLDKGRFLKYFEKKVLKTIKKFNLIQRNNKIAVAVSGGKDSIVALYVLNRLFGKRGHKVEAFAVEEGIGNYRQKLFKPLKELCKKENISLNLFSFKEEYGFSLDKIKNKIKKLGVSNCYVCSILKRYMLNKIARKKGFDVIATGHSIDDEAETILLNQMKGSPDLLGKLGPMSGVSRNRNFVQRIKPLYFCSGKEIILYAKLRKLPLSLEVCPARGETFRISIRNFLKKMEKKHPEIKYAIVNSYLHIMPMLKKKSGNASIKKCTKCGEPCSQEECKRCQILAKLKQTKKT